MKLCHVYTANALNLIFGVGALTHLTLCQANAHDADSDQLHPFIEFIANNSTAPVNIMSLLKGQEPTQHFNNNDQPRIRWFDQAKAGFVTKNIEWYAHVTKLGRIRTDNDTLNFWSDFSKNGFTPVDGKTYQVNWDYLNLEAKGIGAQFQTIQSDTITAHLGANFSVIESFDQRLVNGKISRSGDANTLNATASKISTSPFISPLQSEAKGKAFWLNLQLSYAQPFFPWRLMANAPVLLGSVRIHDAPHITTQLNYSEKNNLLIHNSQSSNIGSYGNSTQRLKLPNFWNLSLEYARGQYFNPLLFIDGVDKSAGVYVGNVWKSVFVQGTDLEFMVDKDRDTYLINVRSQGRYSAGIGFSKLNTSTPVSIKFSYRYQ